MIRQMPATPYTFEYDPGRTAVVFIDFQNDFMLPGGYGESLGNDPALLQRAVAPAKDLLERARAHGLYVVHTREGHEPGLSDCPPSKRRRGAPGKRIGDDGPMGRILVRGEYGHGIIDELSPAPGEPVIDKPGNGAFYATDLDAKLAAKGIATIVVAGVTTEVCVESTVREASDRGYDVLVLKDCVASYKPARHRGTLESIASQNGIFGRVGHSKDFIASLR